YDGYCLLVMLYFHFFSIFFFFFFFFFSSRRRHTRSLRDWSSDVCSSDLIPGSASRNMNRVTGRLAARRYAPQTCTHSRLRPCRRSEERRVGKECRSRGSP